jgi:Ca2+-binding RTX toxin-like protein
MVRGRTGGLIAAATAIAVLAGAQSAAAVVRYASPAGTNVTTCPQIDPCSLQVAVESAAANDEVIVNPGDYNEGANELDIPSTVDVHGASDQPFPRILSSADQRAVFANAGTTLSAIQIEHTGTFEGLRLGSGALAERVLVQTTGATGCAMGTATIRDSVCWTTIGGGSGKGVLLSQGGAVTLTATLRNVTAAATGFDGDALLISASGGGNLTIDAKNVIAFGTGADARASTDSAATATVTLESSNFDTQEEFGTGATVTDPGTGTNQTAAPLFVNAAIGDFHQLAGSPTIDAGAAVDMMGTADLDGDPRTVGAAPDIGADEFVLSPPAPPPVLTPPPTSTPPVTATPAACKGKTATIVGDKGPNKLSGTPAADVIAALGGNDKVSGLAGNDTICGGGGNDTLKGGQGTDTLLGQKGRDTLKGGQGKDMLKGGPGRDRQTQ